MLWNHSLSTTAMHPSNFLENYQQQLTLIHQLMGEFAKQHPKIAARLRLNHRGISDDGEVGRLLEASALSAAKARFHLDDEFSEISDYLLEQLHPHAVAPIPSFSVVQFHFDRKKLTAASIIPTETVLLTEPIEEQRCVFKTCYPVTLLPLECVAAKLMEKPLQAPKVPALTQAESVLQLRLKSTHPTAILTDLNISSLRFFIRAEAKLAYALYELLFDQTIEIVLAISPQDPAPIRLDKASLKPVGFEENEGLLPYGKHTQLGYRLLSEFFLLPEKFLFFDIGGIQQAVHQKFNQPGGCVEFYFYFKKTHAALTKHINAHFFSLHCTPVVNLFESACDPIILNEVEHSYSLSPIKRRSIENSEIYQVTEVTALVDQKKTIKLMPFHGLFHAQQANYYHIERKPAWYFGHYPVPGTEVQLRFTNVENEPLQSKNYKISVTAWCTNRNLPAKIVLKNNAALLSMERKIEGVKEAECLVPFTLTRHPFLNPRYKWKYISHLSLDFLWSLTLDNAVLFFCALLELYAFYPEKHQTLLSGIVDVRCQNTHTIRPGGRSVSPVWHGTEVVLVVDEQKFEKSGLYLFAAVLDRFLPAFMTDNLYTQLIIANEDCKLFEFTPRRGERAAL